MSAGKFFGIVVAVAGVWISYSQLMESRTSGVVADKKQDATNTQLSEIRDRVTELVLISKANANEATGDAVSYVRTQRARQDISQLAQLVRSSSAYTHEATNVLWE